MKSHEALKQAIGSMAAKFATRLGRAASTVYKWTEPSEDPNDSGSRNPVDTLEHIMEISAALGQPQDDALAPLDYLNLRFGRICVEAVPTDRPLPELAVEFCKTMKEFGEMVQSASEAFMDNNLTKQEKTKLLKESAESLRQGAVFHYAVRMFIPGNHDK